MSLLFAVSTSLFPSSHRSVPSDPTICVYLCDTAHNPHAQTTTSPTSSLPLCRSTSFSPPPVYHGILYISRNPHTSHFLAHTSHLVPLLPAHPDHIYPLRSQLEVRSFEGEISPPLFGCLPGGFLWLGPIDRVRVPLVVHLCGVTRGGSWTCTIFFAHLRFSPSLVP